MPLYQRQLQVSLISDLPPLLPSSQSPLCRFDWPLFMRYLLRRRRRRKTRRSGRRRRREGWAGFALALHPLAVHQSLGTFCFLLPLLLHHLQRYGGCGRLKRSARIREGMRKGSVKRWSVGTGGNWLKMLQTPQQAAQTF